MIRSRLVLGVAAVLAGTAVLLVVLGFVYNPVLVVAAVPFALATFFLWSHATGRLLRAAEARSRTARSGSAERTRRRAGEPGATGSRSSGGRRRVGDGAGTTPTDAEAISRRAAADVLDVAPDADQPTVKQAFRDRARDLHPDAPDGDAEAFRRVRAAYNRLAEDR